MPRPSKRNQILDAAERVFADQGYDRATMRQIADEAEVELPAVTYHFKSKLNLYRSIFEKYQDWNESRRTALTRVDTSRPDAVEKIVDAFLLIGMERREDTRTPDYLRIVLREASDPHAYERRTIADYFDPMAKDFITTLGRALPHKPSNYHRWAYLFAVGAYTSTNVDGRAESLGDEGTSREDRLAYLHRFICAGIRGGE